jgi:serine/threonine protein phosphatase PrpC
MTLAVAPVAATRGTVPSRCDWRWESLASPLGRCGVDNQDNLVVVGPTGQSLWLQGGRPVRATVPGWPAGHCRFAVLDGMGGHGHSGRLSEYVARALARLPPFRDLPTMTAALQALHDTTRAEFGDPAPSPRSPRGAGTTLLMLEVPVARHAMLFHVGDSRLFRLADDGLDLLTIDHCPTTDSLLRGELSTDGWQRQIVSATDRRLTQAFGLGALDARGRFTPALRAHGPGQLPEALAGLADRRHVPLDGGALFLLATDGLWCAADPAARLGAVARAVRIAADDGLDAGADRLRSVIAAGRGDDLDDNATFILLRYAPLPSVAADTGPAALALPRVAHAD